MPTYSNEKYITLMRPIPKNWKLDIYGIPYIKRSNISIDLVNNGIWIMGINNANSKTRNRCNKIIHCFKYDHELYRFYNHPYRFLERVCDYYAAATFDFSMHKGMSKAQIINAVFMNRWGGVWLQMNGYSNVIVTVGWVDEETYDICFSGIEDGTVLMISTLGINNELDKDSFLNGYYELRKRFPTSKIICIGEKLERMHDDICYVKYSDSFGTEDLKKEYWQPKIFNWNLKKEEKICLQGEAEQQMDMLQRMNIQQKK